MLYVTAAQESPDLQDERYRLAMAAAGLGAWEYEPGTGRLHCDARCHELIGLPAGSPSDWNALLQQISFEDRERLRTVMQLAMLKDSGGYHHIEYYTSEAAGPEKRRIRASARVIFNEEGVAQRMVGVMQQVGGAAVLTDGDELQASMALDAAGICAWTIYLLEDRVVLDERCRQLHQLPSREIRLATLIESIHPEDLEAVCTALVNAPAGVPSQPAVSEYRFTSPLDGQTRWFRIHGRTFFNAEGRPWRCIGTAQDITAERELQREQQKLLTLVDNSADLMAILNMEGTNSYLNAAGRIMLGFESNEQVLRTPISELHAPEHFALVKDTVLPAVMNRGQWAGQMLVRHLKTGDIFPVFNHTIRIDDPRTGRPLAIGAVMRDLRPELAARRQLEEARIDLEGAIELAELGTWDMDLVHQTITFSDRSREWFGFLPEELPAGLLSTFDRLHPDDRELVKEAVGRALQAGSGKYDAEYRVIHPESGEQRVLHAQGKAHHDADGQPYRFSGTVRDITAQKHRQQELEQKVQARTAALNAANRSLLEANTELARANRDLEDYAYVASHDLQEPLRKIHMYAGLLLTRSRSGMSPVAQANLDKIMESADRMSGLITGLLDLSRISAQALTPEPVRLDEAVHLVIRDLEMRVASSDADIRFGGLGSVMGVSLHLHQLLYNLIGNALKFVQPGDRPQLHLTARLLRTEETAANPRLQPGTAYRELLITDHGIGFAPEYADRIFAIFQRLHSRRQYEGTGIGLALCEKIVRSHGGDIRAWSAGEGKGAVFSVVLPDAP